MKHGKKYNQAIEKIDRQRRYPVADGMTTLVTTATAKFDETIDVAVNLGVNPKHADQMVRGSVALPHGTGKQVRVLVFARGDKEREAQEAGADYVGNDELIDKIKDGWLEFDAAVATPDMMKFVGKIGRILGTRGLMPNPKVGTVTPDVGTAVREIKAGKIEFRVEKTGIIHAPIGRASFGAEKLQVNLLALIERLNKLKPASAKGTYIKALTVSCTMGPGIKLDPLDIKNYMK